MANPFPSKYGFWHVRLWEAAFLLVVCSLLTYGVVRPAEDGRPSVMASIISLGVVMRILYSIKKNPLARKAYPSPMRWPCLSGVISALFIFWHATVQAGFAIGTGVIAAGIVLVLALLVLWAVLEVISWRWSHLEDQKTR